MPSTVKTYPAGALRHMSEIGHLLGEARHERRAITLYLVEQLGRMEMLRLTSKSHTTCAHGITSLHGWVKYAGKWHRTQRCPSDLNMPANGYNDHFAFTNRRLALAYSRFLSNDPTHTKAVAAHHARCARLFSGLGWV